MQAAKAAFVALRAACAGVTHLACVADRESRGSTGEERTIALTWLDRAWQDLQDGHQPDEEADGVASKGSADENSPSGPRLGERAAPHPVQRGAAAALLLSSPPLLTSAGQDPIHQIVVTVTATTQGVVKSS